MRLRVPDPLRRQVENRANACCEYCLLNRFDVMIPHEIDHIVPIKHRGTNDFDNLCLSCFDCNRYKSSDVGSFDTETKILTPLFHPRFDRWEDHFELDDNYIKPISPVGRVTVFVLHLNSDEQLERRAALTATGRYPCQPT